MTILGINTALPTTEIALIDGEKTIISKSWQSNFDEAEKLLPEIIKILPPESTLDQIFVVSGPGSYTGLRIGVTAANVIAMLKKANIKSLNTFDFIQNRLQNRGKTAVILRAGGNNCAVTLQMGEEPNQMPLEQLPAYLKENQITHFFSEKTEIADLLTDQALSINSYEDLLPFDQFLQKILKKSLPEQTLVRPIYLNPPQITPSKKCFT